MNSRPDDWAFHKIDKTIVDGYNFLEEIQVMEYFRAVNFRKRRLKAVLISGLV
jgi:hypothetical protein